MLGQETCVSNTSRRALLGALAATPAVVAARPLPTRAEAVQLSPFVEWERLKESFRASLPNDRPEHEHEARSDSFFHYDYLIRTTPCTTREEAAAKVRALLDPHIGMPVGDCDLDVFTVQQVLAYLVGA